MNVPATKAQRVRAVLDILEHAELGARELTAHLGLPPSKLRSVQRDLEDLQLTGEIERVGSGRYRRPARASTLNPVEALAVYSATRMLHHHAAGYNEHYLSALQKLTAQLPGTARHVAEQANAAYRQRRGAQGGAQAEGSSASRTFELVARAWLEGRVLRFEYHSPTRVSTVELIIYFIELNPQNRQAYAIGVNRLRDGDVPFVFRLARMRDAQLLTDTCEIPSSFDPLEFLSGAWGIMTGEPTRVELFFSPAVRDRVRETPLGPQADVAPLASGHTRVVLTVGGWKELVPWILGWGGEVEVIAPAGLRSHVAQAHAQGAQLYRQTELT
ncbi:helix-turn-helix transcriptional regulator [Deinococcus aquaticus]|uniref:helix-turn-helix transcriptional regulator n=1 Tax=Deinococcus aquaticus TaxID=328692 RepID=UPI003F461A83